MTQDSDISALNPRATLISHTPAPQAAGCTRRPRRSWQGYGRARRSMRGTSRWTRGAPRPSRACQGPPWRCGRLPLPRTRGPCASLFNFSRVQRLGEACWGLQMLDRLAYVLSQHIGAFDCMPAVYCIAPGEQVQQRSGSASVGTAGKWAGMSRQHWRYKPRPCAPLLVGLCSDRPAPMGMPCCEQHVCLTALLFTGIVCAGGAL